MAAHGGISSCSYASHLGWDKMAAISQTTISNACSWMKMLEFRLRFHWSLFIRVQLTLFQHWFRQWLGAGQATSHCLNQWWLVYWRIYVSLGLNELISSFGGLGDNLFLKGLHLADCHGEKMTSQERLCEDIPPNLTQQALFKGLSMWQSYLKHHGYKVFERTLRHLSKSSSW